MVVVMVGTTDTDLYTGFGKGKATGNDGSFTRLIRSRYSLDTLCRV